MRKAPKSVRLHIGIFGRTNVGKSSFLNMISGQDVAIISSVPGTTTDVVEKTMELPPVGPVVFLDTAGIDDISELSVLRLGKTRKIFDRSDIVILIVEAPRWDSYEKNVMQEAFSRNVPVIIVVNKVDLVSPRKEFINMLKKKNDHVILCSSVALGKRDRYINSLKQYLTELCPRDFLKPSELIGDLVSPRGMALLIVPVDLEAPKGRLILPQVQTIRDTLDNDASALVVKETGYTEILKRLKKPPDIVICDSQVVSQMVDETPEDIRCTTFSILFARNRGNLADSVNGLTGIKALNPGDKVLIAEACSHHPIEDDIGREKIPRWLQEHVGGKLDIDSCAGRDYPGDLGQYRLVIHCAGCMITPRETFMRFREAKKKNVAITNYGVCISYLKGVLGRVLSPFPDVLAIFNENFTPRNE